MHVDERRRRRRKEKRENIRKIWKQKRRENMQLKQTYVYSDMECMARSILGDDNGNDVKSKGEAYNAGLC